MKTSFICPLKCGFFTSINDEIASHVFNKCPKRLLLDKDMRFCSSDPTKIATQTHISQCYSCDQRNSKEIKPVYKNSNPYEYEQSHLEKTERKFQNISIGLDESVQIYNNQGKRDYNEFHKNHSKRNFNDSMWEDNLRQPKEKGISKNSTNDTMVDCPVECSFNNGSLFYDDMSNKNKKTHILDDTIMSCTRKIVLNDSMIVGGLNKKLYSLDDSNYEKFNRSQNIQEQDAFDSTFFKNDNNFQENQEDVKVKDPFEQSDYFYN
jgi:hypothetical protein